MIYKRIYAVISIVIILSGPLFLFGAFDWVENLVDFIISAPQHTTIQTGNVVTVQAKAFDPNEASTLIQNAQFSILFPIVMLVTGMLMLTTCIWLLQYREKWFYWSLWVLSIFLMLPFVPFGSITAIFVFVHLLRKKEQYFKSSLAL